MKSLEGKHAAVIGLGRMGLKHLTAYKNAGAKVVAGADVAEEARTRAEEHSPGIRTHGDWRELFLREKPDIVSIVTNGPSHAEIVIAAAESHVPVIFCEKPMATNLADARRMIETCRKNGSKLFINLTLRVFPAFRKFIDLLHAGAIGEIRHISVVIDGKRGLGCVGTHYLDLMRVIARSEVVRAWGRIDRTGTPNPRGAQFRDPGGYGIYEFKNGTRGFVEMSEDISLAPFIMIIGSRGNAFVDTEENRWEIQKAEGGKLVRVPFEAGALTDVVEGTTLAFQDIAGGGKTIASGEDGEAALQMVMALHVSDARGNQGIPLPLWGEDLEFDIPMT